MKVGVIGCGYVGLVTGVGLALKGHQVLAIDINKERVEQISQGVVPFFEPGLAKALKSCLRRKTLRVESSIKEAADCEMVLICVQTPPKHDGSINLKALESAAHSLDQVFKLNFLKRVVVVRSTVIPGTTDNLVTPIFKDTAAVAFNPEFLREGSALADFLNPDRIVIGTHSTLASKKLRQLYSPFNAPVVITTPSTAELSKYAANTLLTTLISFSNEIARVCEKTPDVDVEDVLGIVHRDRRFKLTGGETAGIVSYIKAGCGFGGSCFPKDLSALIAYASSTGEQAQLLKAVSSINASQPSRVVDMVSEALGGLEDHQITVLGAAFKGGTDDLRFSPGLKIVMELLKRKAKVLIYDPLVNDSSLKEYIDQGVKVARNLQSAVKKADACIIASNAPEFRKIKGWKKRFNGKQAVIVDGRRILKAPKNSMDGYYAVGRSRRGLHF